MFNQGDRFTSCGKNLIVAFLLLLLVSSLSSCSSPATEVKPLNSEPNDDSHTLSRSSPINAATDPDLAKRIDQVIDASELGSVRWGISVLDLKDNHVVYERNADKLFTPASNMKLFPTGVALE